MLRTTPHVLLNIHVNIWSGWYYYIQPPYGLHTKHEIKWYSWLAVTTDFVWYATHHNKNPYTFTYLMFIGHLNITLLAVARDQCSKKSTSQLLGHITAIAQGPSVESGNGHFSVCNKCAVNTKVLSFAMQFIDLLKLNRILRANSRPKYFKICH